MTGKHHSMLQWDEMREYGFAKLVGSLKMATLQRRFPTISFFAISPGGTSGTNAANDAPTTLKVMMKVMALLHAFHPLQTGAKRFVEVAMHPERFQQGRFYASPPKNIFAFGVGMTGPLVDQSSLRFNVMDFYFTDVYIYTLIALCI